MANIDLIESPERSDELITRAIQELVNAEKGENIIPMISFLAPNDQEALNGLISLADAFETDSNIPNLHIVLKVLYAKFAKLPYSSVNINNAKNNYTFRMFILEKGGKIYFNLYDQDYIGIIGDRVEGKGLGNALSKWFPRSLAIEA